MPRNTTGKECLDELEVIMSDLNNILGEFSKTQEDHILHKISSVRRKFDELSDDNWEIKEKIQRRMQNVIEKINKKSRERHEQENHDLLITHESHNGQYSATKSYKQPLQLMSLDENGEFSLDEEALASVVCREDVRHRKLIVVSVVGEYRRGKSFLLNFIIRFLRAKGSENWISSSPTLEGFEWRRDMNRVTTGIMLWPEPFLIHEDKAIILIDTQGTFDDKMTMEQNAFVFALSTLISSVQIYNLNQRIQLDTLMNLQYFLEFGRLVTKECEKPAFQHLKILIRDWQFSDAYPFGQDGGALHMTKWLNGQKSVTETLKPCFEKMDCFLMPYPGSTVANSTEFRGHINDIEVPFRKYLDIFIRDLFAPQNMLPKRIGPSVISSQDLLPCMRTFVENLKKSDQKPATLYELTSKIHHNKVVSDAVNYYISTMKTQMPKSADIEKLNKKIRSESMSIFEKAKKFGGGNITNGFKEVLNDELNKTYKDYVVPCIEERERLRKSRIESVLKKAIENHTQMLNECLLSNDFYKLEDVHKSTEKEALDELKGIKSQTKNKEYDEMTSLLRNKFNETYKSLVPKFDDKTAAELDAIVIRAGESYRSKMKEFVGNEACQKIKKCHENAKKIATSEMVKQISKFKKSPKIEVYMTRHEKTITKIWTDFESQNNKLLKVELEKAMRNSVAKYDHEIHEWITKCDKEISVKKLDSKHEIAKKSALNLFNSFRDNLGKEFCKQEYSEAMKKIAASYIEFKKICDNTGKTKAIALVLQKYKAMMEHVGVKEKYVKNLKNLHNQFKEESIKLLLSNKDFSDLNEKLLPDVSQTMDDVFTEYNIFNQGLRTKYLVDIYRSFLNFWNDNVKLVRNTVQKKYIQNLNEQLGKIAEKAFSIVLEAEEDHEEFRDLYENAIKEVDNARKDIVAENMNQKTKEEKDLACSSFMERVKVLGLKDHYVDDLESKLRDAVEDCMNYFVDHANKNKCTNFSTEKSELITILTDLCTKYLQENKKLKDTDMNKLENSVKDGIEAYRSEMRSKINASARVLDNSEIDDIHILAKKKALDVYQKFISKVKISIPEDHKFNLLKGMENALYDFKSENAAMKRERRLKIKTARNEETDYAVGIDLGTTYSCVTVYKDGKFERIMNSNDMFTTPSVVFYSEDDTYVGEDAVMRGQSNCKNCVSGVKRIIGRKFDDPEVQNFKQKTYVTVVDRDGLPCIKVQHNGRSKCLKPEEVTSEVLKEMKRIAGIHLKHEVHDAVVTIPAYFTEPQRSATLEACRLADINVLRLFNEPTAAAITYGVQNENQRQLKILVFDFGGGTCDISILTIKKGEFVVKASHGDNCLGGQDFDKNLMEHIIKTHLGGKTLESCDRSRLLFECERAKRRLSNKTEYEMFLADLAGEPELRANITRKTFNEINSDLFLRALQPIRECLKEADLSESDIDEVVLAGGSSHMPKMQQMLRDFFDGKCLNASINPDEAISHGAALQAALLTGECKMNISIKDITPFSLGTDIVGNKLSVIIEKRSQIPCSATKEYVTLTDNQDGMSVIVYQGENIEEADKNTKLDSFALNNITLAPAGKTKAHVTFTINEDGIMVVTAKEIGNESNEKSITVKRKVN